MSSGGPTGPDGFTRLADLIASDAVLIRLAQAEALRTAARRFVEDMAEAWGGDSQWLTTGARVAEVSACVLREMAADLEAGEDERCVVCGRTARSHGGLCCFHKYDEQPTCDACAADEPASCLTEHSPPQTEET